MFTLTTEERARLGELRELLEAAEAETEQAARAATDKRRLQSVAAGWAVDRREAWQRELAQLEGAYLSLQAHADRLRQEIAALASIPRVGRVGRIPQQGRKETA